MRLRGLLTTSSVVVGSRRVPKLDYQGNVYGWEHEVEEQQVVAVDVAGMSQQDVLDFKNMLETKTKAGTLAILEKLALIRPIGRNEIKQGVVLSYLCYDLLECDIPVYVTGQVAKNYRCEEIVKESDRFFPPHSEFLKNAKKLYQQYKNAFEIRTEEAKKDEKVMVQEEKIKRNKEKVSEILHKGGIPHGKEYCLLCKEEENKTANLEI